MNRYEYLKTLEGHLRLALSRSEINDILRDYGEYFNEGENQGKSEWEIILKLGDPKEVAQQIVSESHKGEVKNRPHLFGSAPLRPQKAWPVLPKAPLGL